MSTADGRFSVEKFKAEGGIQVRNLCPWHDSDLIRARLNIAEDASPSWRVWYIVALLLLFQGTIADERARQFRAGDETTDSINRYLADVGCMACANDSLYRHVARLLNEHGLDYCIKLSKMEIHDDSWSDRLGRSSDKARSADG